jgi:hypothetical protein
LIPAHCSASTAPFAGAFALELEIVFMYLFFLSDETLQS